LNDKANQVVGEKFFAYAEVWENDAQPLAWVSGMTVVKKDDQIGDYYYAALHLNVKWLTHNKQGRLAKPLLLKNAFIQNSQRNVPITAVDRMTVKYDNELQVLNAAFHMKSTGVLTEDMTMGKRPEKYSLVNKRKLAAAAAAGQQGKIALLHGYCAGGNPFSTANFPNHVAFHDPNANRPTDAFALKVKDFIEPHGAGVALIGHSQGGLVSAHLYSFYWSTADMLEIPSAANRTGSSAFGTRRIQSVGSPWEGSGIAGSLAELGQSLGYGCGNNMDLTHDGARNWLATIPMATRKEVFSYITQYADWSWCSMATNMVLEWPNDGCTEQKFAKLEGGNFVGMKKSWCHTSDLKYPPQCTDESRNKELNDNAAR
jgi:ADP-dependent glucokinase